MTEKTIVDIAFFYTSVVFVESMIPIISTSDDVCSEFQSLLICSIVISSGARPAELSILLNFLLSKESPLSATTA